MEANPNSSQRPRPNPLLLPFHAAAFFSPSPTIHRLCSFFLLLLPAVQASPLLRLAVGHGRRDHKTPPNTTTAKHTIHGQSSPNMRPNTTHRSYHFNHHLYAHDQQLNEGEEKLGLLGGEGGKRNRGGELSGKEKRRRLRGREGEEDWV
ncbi:hypothetical protein Droror1_Dr00019705 [Drosera rotundifolia]